jgi:Trypsin-like peptidase domain
MQSHFVLIDPFAGSESSRPRPRERLHYQRLGLILLLFAVALPVFAQEFVPEETVFPITDFWPDIKTLGLSVRFGTGFCLDPDCRFVGTNYHVAKVMGKRVRIKGVFSAHRYLDPDANDAGAVDVDSVGGGAALKYDPAHDLAIYEMRHPLKNFHGVAFDADDLENSPEVDIYAYPFNGNPKRGLVRWHGKLLGKTPQGLWAFRYEEGRVHGGASGGIVVDSKTKKIIGILNGVGEHQDRVALAVPIKELSHFIAQAQPYLQATLFPKTVFVSPVAGDLYPPYVWPRVETLSDRPAERLAVFKLRVAAQRLADSIRNFTATETFAWGHDNQQELSDAYETLVLDDGSQRWRRVGGKKLYDHVPYPPLGAFVGSADEWSRLPEMVGTELNLKIHQAPDALAGGQTIHVFQYSADAEDHLCLFLSYYLIPRGRPKSYSCHGEVWLDELGFILRISEAFDLSGPFYRFRGVMTYGWLEKDGRRYLVPVTIATQAEHSKTYWCRGLFTDYEMFGVKTRLVLPAAPELAKKSSLGVH